LDVFEVRQTETFAGWLTALRDSRAKARIIDRIARVEVGLLGDAKALGDGVSELRIDYGPGYRLYFTRRRREVVILLVGGDKSSQGRDVREAKRLAQEV
jgi:putative addiction module killer protein